jgi:cytochrome c biogenesis protein CcdA/thiol-disulfide isomerase/thioredoxin
LILPILAYLGGVLTILSPCILPVLPFVFARANQSFVRSVLPMLAGMVLTFAAVATLAAVGGGWAVAANEYGRWAALALLAVFGVTLLFPHIGDRLMRPLVGLGGRLSAAAESNPGGSGIGSSFLLGIATGFLWAPCAGPVLGLILTGAALQGAGVATTLLLACYAAGAATSLALALLIGGRIFAMMKRSLGVGEWVRRGLGVAVLVGVVAIAFGVDTGILSKLSTASTASLEQGLLDRLHPRDTKTGNVAVTATLPIEGKMPSIAGAVEWLNSKPLTTDALRGKVVLVDFWTYSCINCLRSIPYVRAWAEKYKDKGLVVLGVHAPEFAFEKTIANVKRAVADLKIDYPVPIDNDYAIWRAFNNEAWPAHYFIDAKGNIRYHHFGEGEYDESETVIQSLLKEAGHTDVDGSIVAVNAGGAQIAADNEAINSPETYVGYGRTERFVSPGGVEQDEPKTYAAGPLKLNDWTLSGAWTVGAESAHLDRAGGRIEYRFHARDLHLVLGPGKDGKPVRFKVTVDGKAPDASHGVDVAVDGSGTVTEQRLYQLVRQGHEVADHTFAIEFLDPDVQAYAFTFG